MTDDRIRRIAQRLFDARNARAPFEWLTGALRPASLEEAYAAQSALHDLWRAAGQGEIAGWKIAVTSKAMQELCGIDQPCVGAVLGRDIYEAPKTVALGDYIRLGLEFELAVRVGEDMDAAGGPYDARSAMARAAGAAPAFELIEDRGADYAGFDAASLVADNTWNAGVVLGADIPNWRDVDWKTQPVTLDYNGEIERAVTGEAMGDPFAALAAVANNLLDRGLMLKAGDLVITGSTVKTRFAEAGDRVRYEIDGLGDVSLEVR